MEEIFNSFLHKVYMRERERERGEGENGIEH